jgi:hypothetical protein
MTRLTHFGHLDLIGQRSIVSNFSLAALSQNARLLEIAQAWSLGGTCDGGNSSS